MLVSLIADSADSASTESRKGKRALMALSLYVVNLKGYEDIKNTGADTTAGKFNNRNRQYINNDVSESKTIGD